MQQWWHDEEHETGDTSDSEEEEVQVFEYNLLGSDASPSDRRHELDEVHETPGAFFHCLDKVFNEVLDPPLLRPTLNPALKGPRETLKLSSAFGLTKRRRAARDTHEQDDEPLQETWKMSVSLQGVVCGGAHSFLCGMSWVEHAPVVSSPHSDLASGPQTPILKGKLHYKTCPHIGCPMRMPDVLMEFHQQLCDKAPAPAPKIRGPPKQRRSLLGGGEHAAAKKGSPIKSPSTPPGETGNEELPPLRHSQSACRTLSPVGGDEGASAGAARGTTSLRTEKMVTIKKRVGGGFVWVQVPEAQAAGSPTRGSVRAGVRSLQELKTMRVR